MDPCPSLYKEKGGWTTTFYVKELVDDTPICIYMETYILWMPQFEMEEPTPYMYMELPPCVDVD